MQLTILGTFNTYINVVGKGVRVDMGTCFWCLNNVVNVLLLQYSKKNKSLFETGVRYVELSKTNGSFFIFDFTLFVSQFFANKDPNV